MFWVNIRKRQRSCNLSETAAMIDAVHTSPLNWKDDYNSDVARMIGRRELRTTLAEINAELRDQPHTPMSLLGDLFGQLTVYSRRGHWRVEFTPTAIMPRCPKCSHPLNLRELWSRAFVAAPFWRWICPRCFWWDTDWYETKKTAQIAQSTPRRG